MMADDANAAKPMRTNQTAIGKRRAGTFIIVVLLLQPLQSHPLRTVGT